MHACMHACMHAYIRTYIHTYVHTYMHMYVHPGAKYAGASNNTMAFMADVMYGTLCLVKETEFIVEIFLVSKIYIHIYIYICARCYV